MGVHGGREGHVGARRILHPEGQEQVGIGGGRGDRQAGGGRAGQFGVLLEGVGPQREPVAHRLERPLLLALGRFWRQLPLPEVEVQLGPAGLRDRPARGGAFSECPVHAADPESDWRLAVPAGFLAFEEVAEEPLLEADAVVGVQLDPVLQAVHLEPLLLAGHAQVAFEPAAGVQVVGPVRGGQHRDLDLGQVGGPLDVVVVEQRVHLEFLHRR
jgi:hypothetical protein